jgi:hypothetical protein
MRTLPWWMLAGCLPDISGTLDPGPKDGGGGTTVVDTASGEVDLVVDATSYDDWVGLDLDLAELADPTGDAWDLAFRRFEVMSNGGISGDGGVEAAPVAGVAFEDLVDAPAEGWRTDAPDANDDDVPEYALVDWYIYDYDTHLLAVNEVVWVVRSTEGALFKLAFDSYYDDNGTPGRISLRFAPL